MLPLEMPNTTARSTATTAATAPAARRRRGPAGPASRASSARRAGAGPRLSGRPLPGRGGGRHHPLLQRRGGGATAVAVASRAVVSRSLATSCAHSSHRARWRSNLARSPAHKRVHRVGPGQRVRLPPRENVPPRNSLMRHPQAVAQPDQRVPHPGLDRAGRHAEQAGDLAIGVAAVVGQGDRLALQLGERAQAAPDPLAFKARLDGLGHLVEGDVGGGGTPLALGFPLHRTDPVHRPAVRQRHHPGHRGAPAGVELGRVPPHLEQHLLGDLLGLGRIADHPPDDAEHGRGHLVVDRVEGRLVAPGHQPQAGQRRGRPGWPASGLGARLPGGSGTVAPPSALSHLVFVAGSAADWPRILAAATQTSGSRRRIRRHDAERDRGVGTLGSAGEVLWPECWPRAPRWAWDSSWPG